MKSQSNHPTNFWFGFALGTTSVALLAYLLGTKKGRQSFKKLIELSENMENISPSLLSGANEMLDSIVEFGINHSQLSPAHQEKNPVKNSTLENVISKIKHATQPDKYVKKFFAKGGKIIEP